MCTPRIAPAALRDDLHHPVGLAHDERAPVAHPAVHRRLDVVAALVRLRLGETAERDLGMAVDAPRAPCRSRSASGASPSIVLIATIASENATCASCGVATTSPTAYTPSTFVRMLPSTDDEAALVDLDPRAVEPDVLRARPAARPTRRPCRPARISSPFLPSKRTASPSKPSTLHAGLRLDAALLERAHDRLRDLLVDTGEHLRQRFEDRDLGARRRRGTTRTHIRSRRHRSPRRAAGIVVELQHVVGRQHLLAVERETVDSGARAATNRSRSTRCGRGSSMPSETLIERPSGASMPVPGTTVTLRPFSRLSSPEVSRSMTVCLRVCEVASGSAGSRRRARRTRPRDRDRAQHLGGLQQLLGRDAARGAGTCRRRAAPRRCAMFMPALAP